LLSDYPEAKNKKVSLIRYMDLVFILTMKDKEKMCQQKKQRFYADFQIIVTSYE